MQGSSRAFGLELPTSEVEGKCVTTAPPCPVILPLFTSLFQKHTEIFNNIIHYVRLCIRLGAWEVFSPDILENIITDPGKHDIFKCARLNKSLNFLEDTNYVRNVNNEQLMNINSRNIHR